MLSFVNDYSEGAHEQVLRRLAETNREQHPGYGTDPYCARAKEKIRRACGCPEGDVFFLVGGTQTNQAVISALLAPWEGVIAPATGHICTHEAGAIEATGTRCWSCPSGRGSCQRRSCGPIWRLLRGREPRTHGISGHGVPALAH